jgi:hypothetical protein
VDGEEHTVNESWIEEATTDGGAGGRPATGAGLRRSLALLLAGALLAGCQGGSATPNAQATVTAPTTTATATQTAAPTATPTASPTAAPTVTPTAPIALITFNAMMLDALADPQAQARTFTFKSDGPGPVSVAVVKNKKASDSTKLCVAVDGGVPACQSGGLPSFAIQATTSHSAWTVQVISAGNVTTPVVDIAMSWPTNSPKIGLAHGRLQGSMSPGVPEELNGFNVTFKPRGAGNFTVSSRWTVILTDIDVTLANVTGMPWVNLDEQQYHGGGSGVSQVAYTHAVDPSKTYRFSLRDLDADNYRPDLSADISFP